MSDAFVGADVAQLEGIASRLDTEHAVAIENVMTAVDGIVSELPTVWRGNDAKAFADQWTNTHRQMLNNAVLALREASTAARRNAQAQQTTSETMA